MFRPTKLCQSQISDIQDQMGGIWQHHHTPFEVTFVDGSVLSAESGSIWNGNGYLFVNPARTEARSQQVPYEEVLSINISGDLVFERHL